MTVVWLLAHCDDEYCAAPLLLRRREQGLPQRFLFLADYPSRRARARVAESRALLAHFGVEPAAAVHLGAEVGVPDGALIDGLEALFAAVGGACAGLAVDEIVTSAWEGGHPDHDACALLAARLQAALPGRPPVRQFGLYHGRGLAGPLFHGCAPLPENGPTRTERLTARAWADWAAAVRFYPSQAAVWSTLWPAMFAGFARRGFRSQTLRPERVRERPHSGALLYERTRRARYDEVRARADAFLAG
jgi:LmbE family N-acetylglucosaminyl deacetylase